MERLLKLWELQGYELHSNVRVIRVIWRFYQLSDREARIHELDAINQQMQVLGFVGSPGFCNKPVHNSHESRNVVCRMSISVKQKLCILEFYFYNWTMFEAYFLNVSPMNLERVVYHKRNFHSYEILLEFES